jgi:uncharacterized membrane protein YjgN (DUF898 family)
MNLPIPDPHGTPTLPPPGGALTVPPPFRSAGAPEAVPLVFTGRGGEYFGIWIVNLLLTIVTLGIYSAWAKVRRMQYFYRNTSLAGASFDYHGDPRAILKGRVIMFALFMVYNLAIIFAPVFGLLIGLLLAGVMPILLQRSLRFRAHNTSWSGLRFGFDGSQGGAYRVFLLWPFLTMITLYLLGPMWHQRLKQYQHRYARFGATPFTFDAPVGGFYRVYLMMIGILILGVVVAAAVGGFGAKINPATAALIPLGIFLLLLFVQPYVMAKLQNLVWNHTQVGPHRFDSHVAPGRLFFIFITNLIGIVLTLGLYQPFAAIRLAKYRLESVSLLAAGPLDDFVAGQQQQISATGEGAADVFDIDIAL